MAAGQHLGVMREHQLDLFSAGGVLPETSSPSEPGCAPADPVALEDNALIAAIPEVSFNLAQALALEAARRRLAAAVPALERLCRRLKGLGFERPAPEQLASLNALTEIGGAEAAKAVSRVLCQDVVQGPALAIAVAAAARLGVVLPDERAASLLRHADPAVRADACRCAPAHPAAIAVLIELLDDLNTGAATAAACALGRMGQAQSRPALLRWLRQAPSAEVIEAISEVACDEAIVLLGRIASSDDVLAGQAFEALEAIDNPRARRLTEILAKQGRNG
jgi:hypothetical protein